MFFFPRQRIKILLIIIFGAFSFTVYEAKTQELLTPQIAFIESNKIPAFYRIFKTHPKIQILVSHLK